MYEQIASKPIIVTKRSTSTSTSTSRTHHTTPPKRRTTQQHRRRSSTGGTSNSNLSLGATVTGTSSSSLEDSQSIRSRSTSFTNNNNVTTAGSNANSLREIRSGGWKWSKPRQIAFWVKHSVRDVVTPDLSCVYESSSTTAESPQRKWQKKGQRLVKRLQSITTLMEEEDQRIEDQNGEDHDCQSKSSTAGSSSSNNIPPFITDFKKLRISKSKRHKEENNGVLDQQNNEEDIMEDDQDDEEEEEPYSYPPCESIDHAMSSLYTLNCPHVHEQSDNGDNDSDDLTDTHSINDEIQNNYDEDEDSISRIMDFQLNHDILQYYNDTFFTFSDGTESSNVTNHKKKKSRSRNSNGAVKNCHTYDWLLDGDIIVETNEGGRMSKKFRKRAQQKQFMLNSMSSDATNNGLEVADTCHSENDSSAGHLHSQFSSEANNANNPNNCFQSNGELIHVLAGMELESSSGSGDSGDYSSDQDVEDDNDNTIGMSQSMVDLTSEEVGASLSPPKEESERRRGSVFSCDSNGDQSDDDEYDDDDVENDDEASMDQPGMPEDFTLPSCITTNLSDDKTGLARFPTPWVELSNDDEEGPLLGRFPLESTYNLEGRFTRRVQLDENLSKPTNTDMTDHDCKGNEENPHHTNDSIEEKDILPQQYYTEDYEPLLDILKSTPWDEFNNSSSQNNEAFDQAVTSDIDDFITQTLSELDETSNKITRQLVDQIKLKEDDINNVLGIVQHVDSDIASANHFVEQAKTLVSRSRGREAGRGGGIILGSVYVIEQSDKRETFRELDALLETCESLLEKDMMVTKFCSRRRDNFTHDLQVFSDLLGACTELKTQLSNEEHLCHLECLKGVKERAPHMMQSICDYLDYSLASFLSRRCNCPASPTIEQKWNEQHRLEYKKLLNARYLLQDNLTSEIEENNRLSGEEKNQVDCRSPRNIASSWSKSVMKALCFEVDKSLARALLDPTVSAADVENDCDDELSEFDQNLLEARMKISEIQANDNDAASLRSLTQNLLMIRFQFESEKNRLPWVFHKLCVHFANILHVQYLLSEWPSFLSSNDFTDGDVEDKSSSNEGRTLEDSELGEISLALIQSRLELWNHCESTILHLLNTYVSVSSKQESPSHNHPDNQSQIQLEQLHDVFQLTNQLLSLASEFLGLSIAESEGICPFPNTRKNCQLKDTLSTIFQKHLRTIHIEAMTDLGITLANESWQLISLPLEARASGSTSPRIMIRQCLEGVLQAESPTSKEDSRILNTTKSRNWHNQFTTNEASSLLPMFFKLGNPFMSSDVNNHESGEGTVDLDIENEWKSDSQTDLRTEIYEKLASCITMNAKELLIANKSTLQLAKWTSRLLQIMMKLPIISDNISSVICNIYDLYYLTIFRLCMGNCAREEIILGLKSRSESSSQEQIPQDMPSYQQRKKILGMTNDNAQRRRIGTKNTQQSSLLRGSSFGRNRRNSSENGPLCDSYSNAPTLKYIEADIYSPLRSEEDTIKKVREFVSRGQKALSTMVNLDKIEGWSTVPESQSDRRTIMEETLFTALAYRKQAVASFSFLFVSILFDIALQFAEKTISPKEHDCSPSNETKDDDSLSGLSDLFDYRIQVFDATTYMHTLCMRLSAIRALRGEYFVQRIIMIQNRWLESKLNESCNDYVDTLSERCAMLWGHLSTSKVPETMLTNAWNHIVESGFLSLLEGFSKVLDCSTEGRALMSIDLATFCSSVDGRIMRRYLETNFGSNPRMPPASSPTRGMQYVDMYIKVFYFPEEDSMGWIRENRDSYHLCHLLSLLFCGKNSHHMNNNEITKLSQLRDQVRAL